MTAVDGSVHAGDPVAGAIAVARFTDGTFGWGVKEPGHGLVFAGSSSIADAIRSVRDFASGDPPKLKVTYAIPNPHSPRPPLKH